MEKRFYRFKKRAKDEQGAAAVLVAFCLVIILGFAAMALDYGMVYYKKAELQNAVDIASRVSSRLLVSNDLTDAQKQVQCVAKAKYYLKQNGFPESDLSVCDIQVDPTKGISIDAQYFVNYSFGKIFKQDGMTVEASGSAVTDYYKTEGKKVTVDVCFVLDISGSMYWTKTDGDLTSKKLIPMINSVNKAINSILAENADNRISVVVFSSASNTMQIMKLRKSPGTVSSARINGTNYPFQTPSLEIPNNYIGYYIDERMKQNTSRPYNWYLDTIYIAVGSQDLALYQQTGGTFTQMGIAVAGKVLSESESDGEMRVPSIFVLSDGEATYGNTQYNTNIRSRNIGDGTPNSLKSNNSANASIGYYTILTANYWKERLSQIYTDRNGQETDAQFYSCGFDLGDTSYPDYAQGVLDPDSIKNYANTGPGRKLQSLLKSTSNPYKGDYSYPTIYYDANDEEALDNVMENFANDVVVPVKTYSTRLTR